jgi:hypothetical protein
VMKRKRGRSTSKTPKLLSVPDARPFTADEEAFFAAGSQELPVSPAESFDDLDVDYVRKPSLISRFFSRLQVG